MKDLMLYIVYVCIIILFLLVMFCYQTPIGRIGGCILGSISTVAFLIYNYLEGRE